MGALRPVALLVFLTASARAWIVAADLGAAHDRLGRGLFAADKLQLRHFPFFLALYVAREVLHRGLGGDPLLLGRIGSGLGLAIALFLLVLLGERQHRSGARIHLQEEQVADRLVLHTVHHGGEQRVRFLLVFD